MRERDGSSARVELLRLSRVTVVTSKVCSRWSPWPRVTSRGLWVSVGAYPRGLSIQSATASHRSSPLAGRELLEIPLAVHASGTLTAVPHAEVARAPTHPSAEPP